MKIQNLFTPLANGDIEINKIELSKHKFLHKLINKPKTKDNVEKLMYIYLMSDIGSMYSHLIGDEKLNAVKAHLGFDVDWYPTPDLVIATDAYKELVEITPLGRAYLTACKAIYELGKDLERNLDIVAFLKQSLEKRVTALNSNNSMTETDKVINIQEAQAFISEISNNQKQLISNIKDLPNMLKIVKDLANSFAEESSTAQEIHGGGSLGNRE